MSRQLVFVVEHNMMVRSSITKRLTRKDFRVRSFESGEAALIALTEEQPDLVLLDYKMPGLNGEQILEKMFKMGLSIPVVLLTAHRDFLEVFHWNYQGPVSVVTKSLELEDIVLVVQNAMSPQ